MINRTFLTVVAVLFALSVSIGTTTRSASASLLVYEPFAYRDGWLTGQSGALGTTGTWMAYDTLNSDWRIHQEGDTAGVVVDPGPPIARNMFDGTVANLLTSGGYTGVPGAEDIGRDLVADFEVARYMNASIALDPSVTEAFQSGTVTWFSYVTAHGWDRNERAPHLIIGTDTTPNGNRGLNLNKSGNGIGGGGGAPRNNRTDISPQFFRDGVYNHSPTATGSGTVTSYGDSANELPDATHTMPWDAFDGDGNFGPPNIVVGKIEWDADTGGEDIISVVRFLETDTLSEAAFDALIALKPALSSANWPSNKPDLDQSQFDTIDLSGTKFFIDEFRIATTFGEVVPLGTGDSAPFVDAGVDMITWFGQVLQLDSNVVNNDPCDPQTPLTYLWTAAPDDGVEFDPNEFVEAPAVTITKATDNPSIVTLTLSINNVGSGKDDVVDTMTIDVYDDNCLAAIDLTLAVIDPTDLDGDCITAFEDFALMAMTWLDDYSLTEPVAK